MIASINPATGETLRTFDALSDAQVDAALALGWSEAERLRGAGYIVAAALHLMGETRVCGAPSLGARPSRSPLIIGKSGRDARGPAQRSLHARR